METSCNKNINIFKFFRFYNVESSVAIASKVNWKLQSITAREWGTIMRGRVENTNTFILNERQKIVLDHPMFSIAQPHSVHGVVIEPGCLPIMQFLRSINYGREEEIRNWPCDAAFPMLRINNLSLGNLFFSPGIDDKDLIQARKYAPQLGICNGWDNPSARQNESNLSWRYAAIEDEQDIRELVSKNRIVLSVYDMDQIVRHLITIIPWKSGCLVLPLSFAQHPNFSSPMSCYFAFEPCWWLYNSDYLNRFPDAEIVITNELGVALSNQPNEKQIILGHFFGHGAIPFLHLECLRGRQISILVICPREVEGWHEEDEERWCEREERWREDIHEAVLLLSRFEDLNIEASCCIAHELAGDCLCEPLPLPEIYQDFVIRTAFRNPISYKKKYLFKEAIRVNLTLPDNLRSDRYGALSNPVHAELISGLVSAGGIVNIVLHDECDISLFTVSLIFSILTRKVVFPEQQENGKNIRSATLIPLASSSRYHRILRELKQEGSYPFYDLSQCSKGDIEITLNGIIAETSARILIFSYEYLIGEYKKELVKACDWAAKRGVGLVFVTTETVSSATIMNERDVHVWNASNTDADPVYILEDRPLLKGNSKFSKIIIRDGRLETDKVDEQEVKALNNRKVARLTPALGYQTKPMSSDAQKFINQRNNK